MCIFVIARLFLTILKLDCHGRMDGETLKSYTTHWPPERWQEYEPILNYCRENGIHLVACGTPLKVCSNFHSN